MNEYNLGKKDSNLQPSDSESDALPIKLFPNITKIEKGYKAFNKIVFRNFLLNK